MRTASNAANPLTTSGITSGSRDGRDLTQIIFEAPAADRRAVSFPASASTAGSVITSGPDKVRVNFTAPQAEKGDLPRKCSRMAQQSVVLPTPLSEPPTPIRNGLFTRRFRPARPAAYAPAAAASASRSASVWPHSLFGQA